MRWLKASDSTRRQRTEGRERDRRDLRRAKATQLRNGECCGHGNSRRCGGLGVTAAVETGATGVPTAFVAVTVSVYPEIVDPSLLAGAVHDRDTFPSLGTAITPVGTLGPLQHREAFYGGSNCVVVRCIGRHAVREAAHP